MFCANEINHVDASFSNASEQSYKRLFVFNTYKITNIFIITL